jgi:hypothetical protein
MDVEEKKLGQISREGHNDSTVDGNEAGKFLFPYYFFCIYGVADMHLVWVARGGEAM